MATIEVRGLCKWYGSINAVKDISFSVDEGEIVGFLGPNGAGKTTTMNIITGYISSSEGSVTIGGYNILEQPSRAKAQIGYLPENPPLYPDMTVDEYLSFIYELKGCLLPKEEHISEVCSLAGVEKVRRRLIKNLSKGYRQRVGIAQALVCSPPVLILDEPTVGLDPNQIVEIRSLIKKLGEKHTIILSTHILSEVQTVCDRVIVLSRGQLVADNTTKELHKSVSDGESLNVRIAGPERQIYDLLLSIDGVSKVQRRGEAEKGVFEFDIVTKLGKDVRRKVFNLMCAKNWAILQMKPSQLDLEDIFATLTV
ncbi:MAG: ABC transporter ATP-binding protein [Oscillospiraceae bacterium]|jgi:ABC-2 type transport system ATP-binding protein|nr:ABC transporter ATP-binding protein [Oscillospiraceae bacterium]